MEHQQQESPTATTDTEREAIGHMMSRLQEGATMAEIFGFDEATLAVLEGQAYRLYQNQRFEQAKIAGLGVLALDGDRVVSRLIMGDMALEEYRFSDAIEHLERAHQLSPEEFGISARLGEALLKSGKKERARHHLQTVVAAGKEAGENNLRRCQVLLESITTP